MENYDIKDLNVLRPKTYVFVDVENVGCGFELFDSPDYKYIFVTHMGTRLEELRNAKRNHPFIQTIDVGVSGEQVADMRIYSEICKIAYSTVNPSSL